MNGNATHDAAPLRHDDLMVPASHPWRRIPLVAGIVGLAALVASLVLGWGSRQFFFSYLVAYCFFVTLALGGLFFVIVQFAARAGWSVVVRRIAEHVMSSLPLFALLFLPIAWGAHDLYHWTHHDVVGQDPVLQAKAPYLNLTAFYVRAVIYFVSWLVLALYFYRRSVSQDRDGAVRKTRRMQVMAGPAIALFGFTLSFAAFDWIMSLEPHWYSTIFGVYIFSGAAVAIFAFISIFGVLAQRARLLTEIITGEHYHDLGKLLFAFVVFWAYIAFSQFMLIWYGNLPEETIWYEQRAGGWLWFSVLLACGHFLAPFFFLLPSGFKRARTPLLLASVWMLLMHYVDLYWLIMPTLHKQAPLWTVLDLTTFVGIGGLFLAVVGWQVNRHALVPARDPRLGESLAFENI